MNIEEEIERVWQENAYLNYDRLQAVATLDKSSFQDVAKHFYELGLKAQSNIALSNIDDVIRENGLDPDSKEAKVFKEAYYVAIDKAFEKFKKGE